ncbi:MAG: radical SAM protein, partial [Rhodospirillales bacterium]|nr:radical SAM protein [Rhodospirillales bacterium]
CRRYFVEHPFVDVAVRAEGEEAMAAVLTRLLEGHDLDGIPGLSWRTPEGEYRADHSERPFNRDLDLYPSPYLTGLYEEVMRVHPEMNFQAIIETNRGCPFHCTFCYWGKGGLSRKYRYHSIERVAAELKWMGEHEIRYVFNADSNFGMHRRDIEIANILVETKKTYGFPEKFRTCYGKNTDSKILKIGTLLHENSLEKGVTISYQSIDPQVQKNIKRDNIKLSSANELQRGFNNRDLPVYTELIVGLPGETWEGWIGGINSILQSGLKNQLFIYLCQVYPNTELGDPEYQKKFGIVTRRVRLNDIHGIIRPAEWVSEYEDIVIRTGSMSTEDWRRMLMVSWLTMTIHSLKLGFFVLAWLVDRFALKHSDFLLYLSEGRFPHQQAPMLLAELRAFERKVESLLAGEGRGCELPEYGAIYWDVEEACFLRLSRDFDGFFEELGRVLRTFLDERGIDCPEEELQEVVRYQRMRVPTPTPPIITQWSFSRSFPEYFDHLFSSEPVALTGMPQVLEIDPIDFTADRPRYARETILWGRKSGLLMNKARWFPPMAPERPLMSSPGA